MSSYEKHWTRLWRDMALCATIKNMTSKPPMISQSLGGFDLANLSQTEERVNLAISQIRNAMLAPTAQKTPPTFSSTQLMALCGLDKGKFEYRARKGDLPDGIAEGAGRRRFTVRDLRTWSRAVRAEKMRPEGRKGVVITVANFKGGVTKTTTAVTLAQGLSLRGHKVLAIDTDPQSSMTNLFGILSDVDMTLHEDLSILPLMLGLESNLDYSVQNTYWPGIDIISANLGLYAAEFALPSRQKEDPSFEFWHVLRDGIESMRQDYDVIVIDTPPSLSYTTINALLAADGIIIPLPPSHLDFMSSGQFWSLLNELMYTLITKQNGTKRFSFVDVLLTCVNTNDASSSVVREWILAAYADLVLPVEIPLMSATSAASVEFGTVYDMDVSKVNARTYRRAFDANERMVELIEQQVVKVWEGEKA